MAGSETPPCEHGAPRESRAYTDYADDARGACTARPRLVATDLDGTLLDADGLVSPRTQRALAGVAAAGITTVFVTARPPRWLHPLESSLDEHGIAICGNGAFVYRVGDRTMLQATGIERDVLASLVRDIRAAVPEAGFAAETDRGAHVDRAFADARQMMPSGVRDVTAVQAPIEEVRGTVGKLLVRSPELESATRCEAAVEAIAEIVGGRAEVAFSGAVGLAEIGPLGVTKASTLATFCRMRGIAAHEVWAFGDMPNDLPMLAWAGRSFAVGNAHPDVRAAATDHIGRHDEDGVAATLETLL